MIILKEETQINRPLLYLAGGLVLGETMALWMTVKQECFGLAVLLPVFFCVLFRGWMCGEKKGAGLDRSRRLAFFVVGLGVMAGIFRMETEEWIVRREEAVVSAVNDGDRNRPAGVTGRVKEIGETEYGMRILLGTCSVGAAQNEVLTAFQSPGQYQMLMQSRLASMGKVYAYIDADPALKLGMTVYVEGELELSEPDRNPGGFDYRLYCRSKGVGGILSGERAVILDSSCLVVQEGLRQIGLYLDRQLEMIADEKDAGLLKAILLGKKSDIDDQIYGLYRQNGISHVLAISGLHVSVIGMGLWRGLRALGMGYWSSGVVAFSVLFGFGSIAGFGPSVIRAVFMMGISFLAGGTGRTYDLPSAMSVPAMGLLLWRPYLLTQASFQLSFLAVFAIFFPGGVIWKAWERSGEPAGQCGTFGRWIMQNIRQSLVISGSIQIVTIPVILYHSFEIPAYGIVLNLIVVPLTTYVLVSGILGIAGSLVRKEMGVLFLGGAHYILAFYEWLCLHVQGLFGARVVLGRPEIWEIAIYYGCVVLGTWLAVKKRRVWPGLWIAAVFLFLPAPEPGLSVTFLDVGQGDGIVLQYKGRTMLVDCGSSQEKELGEDCLCPFLMSQGIRRLDTVVVSHGDQDHMSAVRYLLEQPDCGIEVGQLIMSEVGCRDEISVELERLAAGREIPVRFLSADDRPEIAGTVRRTGGNGQAGESGMIGSDVEILCLYPECGMEVSDRNDGSLVLKISYGNFSMLLTGDVGTGGELAMKESGKLSPVTVLKAAHHGSASSTCQEFLDAVQPEYVIFSYGKGNWYGHPAESVVERCKQSGAKIFETARHGAVQIWTDGERMRIFGWLDRPGGI